MKLKIQWKCRCGEYHTGTPYLNHQPQPISFSELYEKALVEGNKRFGSDCKHEHIKDGVCLNCLRKVRTNLYDDTRDRLT